MRRVAPAEGHHGHFRIAAQNSVGKPIRPAKRGFTQPDFLSVDEATNALPRLLNNARQRRSRVRSPCHRGGHQMMARKRQSTGEIEHVLRDSVLDYSLV